MSILLDENIPFYDQRRQQFLSEEFYERAEPHWQTLLHDYTVGRLSDRSAEDDEYNCGEGLRWNGIASIYMKLFTLHYTAGLPIESFANEFEQAVIAKENEMRVEGDYFWDGKALNAVMGGGESSYLKSLQWLSLSYLLNRRDLILRIKKLIEGEGEPYRECNDVIYMDLIHFGNPNEPTIETVYWNRDFQHLANALYENNSKEEALADLTSYLEGWYELNSDQSWHNGHLNLNQYSYSGYWAYEAAAVVFLLDLDDSSLHRFLHYPKDLVAYARSQKDAPAPKIDLQPVVPPSSRYTGKTLEVGDTCQHVGWYEAPYLDNRVVLLQTGQKIEGDAYNHRGKIIWYELTETAAREHLAKINKR